MKACIFDKNMKRREKEKSRRKEKGERQKYARRSLQESRWFDVAWRGIHHKVNRAHRDLKLLRHWFVLVVRFILNLDRVMRCHVKNYYFNDYYCKYY